MIKKNTWLFIVLTILTVKVQASHSWETVMRCSGLTEDSAVTVLKNSKNQLQVNLELMKNVDKRYAFLDNFKVKNSYTFKNLQAQREEMDSNSIYISEKNYLYFLNFNSINMSGSIMIHDPANKDDFSMPLLCSLDAGVKITGAGKNISFVKQK